MTRPELIAEINKYCPSLDVETLNSLTTDELDRIDCVDCLWCEEYADLGFESAEEAVSMALYAEYEEIIFNK